MRILLVLLSLASAGWAAGTQPKPAAAEYPAQVRLSDAEVGADYLVHSIAANQDSISVDDYLVVELAFYPLPNATHLVNSSRFTLRTNGKKDVILSQTPSSVIASVKYPDWRQRPELQAGAGMGDTGIVIGRRTPVGRFPGDPTVTRDRLPRRPTDAPSSPVEVEVTRKSPEELINSVALPEGPTKHPVSGYLFFPYRGKLSSLKKVELLIHTESEPVVLRLR